MQQVAHEAGVKVGIQGSLVVISYEITPTVSAIPVLERACATLFGDRSKKLGVMVLIRAEDPPSQELRAALAKLMKAHDGQVQAVAQVIPGEGLFRATVRAVLVGMAMLARTTFPMKVSSNPGAAAAWMAEVAPSVISPAAVAQVAAEIIGFRDGDSNPKAA